VVIGLHLMIKSCSDKGLLKGLRCRDDSNAIINLHFADDTLILKNVLRRLLYLNVFFSFLRSGQDWELISTRVLLSFLEVSRSAASLYHGFLAVQWKDCLLLIWGCLLLQKI